MELVKEKGCIQRGKRPVFQILKILCETLSRWLLICWYRIKQRGFDVRTENYYSADNSTLSMILINSRSSPSEVFLAKGVLEICSKFTGQHPCQNMISIKLLYNFIEIALRYGCSPVNLLHIFRTHFHKNIYGWLLL